MTATENVNYKHILDEYDEEVVIKRGLYWFRQITDYINEEGLSKKVRIDKLSLVLMILSYFEDIIRLKSFHGIEFTNREKIFAYSCYWFLRFSPVQLLEELNLDQHFINERIAVSVLVSEFAGQDASLRANPGFLKRFMHDTLYHFIYRFFTPQTIELTLTALSRSYSSKEKGEDSREN